MRGGPPPRPVSGRVMAAPRSQRRFLLRLWLCWSRRCRRGGRRGAGLRVDDPKAERIDVLPARFELINRKSEAGVVGATFRLKKALSGWTEDYDVVLLDTRPELGHLVQMAIVAADTVLIVAAPEHDAVAAAVRDFVVRPAANLANRGRAGGRRQRSTGSSWRVWRRRWASWSGTCARRGRYWMVRKRR